MNNASYLSYFEVGRVEWLRAAGFSYRELELGGYGFVVVEARIHYRKAAVFDDELNLATTLAETRRASLRFEYVLKRGEDVVCTGYTRHSCLDLRTGRPSRIPSGLATTTG